MIRKGLIGDAERIAEIFSETLTPWSVAGVLASIEKDYCLVSENEKVDGVIFISRAADECEVLNFAVDKSRRGKGIGALLLKEALSGEFTEKADVFLDVRESNEPAIHLYKKFGFKEISVRKNYYTNPTENAVIMKLER